MKEYKIYIRAKCGWFLILRVFKNQAQMHKAMDKANKDPVGCAGMFSPTGITYETYPGGIWYGPYYQGCLGVIWLYEKQFGAGVVGHECLHAAMCAIRRIERFDMRFDAEDIDENEEKLGEYFTIITQGVYNILYDNKHIKTNT